MKTLGWLVVCTQSLPERGSLFTMASDVHRDGIMGRKISRTGGDYVWVSRTLGGFLGSSLSFMGYTAETFGYLALITLSAVFAVGSVGLARGNSGFLGLALPEDIPGSDTSTQFLVGAGIFAFLVGVNMVKPKAGFKIVTTCIILGVVAILVSIGTLLAAGHQGVVSYVNGLKLVDNSNNPMTYDSIANSYAGSTFDLGATISILPFFATFVYPWINAGPAVGSELKGSRTQHWNVPFASAIALVLVTAAFATMYLVGGLPFTNQALANLTLVFNNSFNFWTLAMGDAGSTVLQAFVGLGWILWNVGILAYGVIVISRYLLAQAFDRFMPLDRLRQSKIRLAGRCTDCGTRDNDCTYRRNGIPVRQPSGTSLCSRDRSYDLLHVCRSHRRDP